MHMHNAWLLEKPELNIDLPVEFFESPKLISILWQFKLIPHM